MRGISGTVKLLFKVCCVNNKYEHLLRKTLNKRNYNIIIIGLQPYKLYILCKLQVEHLMLILLYNGLRLSVLSTLYPLGIGSWRMQMHEE